MKTVLSLLQILTRPPIRTEKRLREKKTKNKDKRGEGKERERREREPYNNLVWDSQLEELTVDKNQLIEGSCYTTAPN